MRRRAAETRRCWKWRRCARDSCWRATPRKRMPACRSRTWSNAGQTSRSCWTTASFRPCCTRGRRTRLATLTTELLGLFHQRGEALGGRVAATGRGAAAEFADFLMLQTINRYEPLLAHYADSGALHPEELFQVCVSAAGELATFTTTSKRPPKFPGYRHDRLRESFEPVIASLRESLSKVLTQTAIPIPLELRKFGISVAIVPDRELFSTAVFILAARADVAGRGPAAALSGAAQDRSGREDWRPGDAGAPRSAGARRTRRAPANSLITRGSRISSSIRPTSSGISSRPRVAWPCTSRASFRA